MLNFLPESSLNNINLDTSWKISRNPENGTINFIYKTNPFQYGVVTHTVYINSDLKGDARTHWILRSLLFELGFPGETGIYPDSIFYSESDTTTSLSKIDLKALELMYSTKISHGMDLYKIKQLLFIDSSVPAPIASPVHVDTEPPGHNYAVSSTDTHARPGRHHENTNRSDTLSCSDTGKSGFAPLPGDCRVVCRQLRDRSVCLEEVVKYPFFNHFRPANITLSTIPLEFMTTMTSCERF